MRAYMHTHNSYLRTYINNIEKISSSNLYFMISIYLITSLILESHYYSCQRLEVWYLVFDFLTFFFFIFFLLGCILPFNNIASSLLLERNYFVSRDTHSECRLQHTDACQSGSNVPVNCSFSTYNRVYQPPLPRSIVIEGIMYECSCLAVLSFVILCCVVLCCVVLCCVVL